MHAATCCYEGTVWAAVFASLCFNCYDVFLCMQRKRRGSKVKEITEAALLVETSRQKAKEKCMHAKGLGLTSQGLGFRV